MTESDDDDAPLSSLCHHRTDAEESRLWEKQEKVTSIPDFTMREGPNVDEFQGCSTPTGVFCSARPTVATFECELYGFVGINFLMGYRFACE